MNNNRLINILIFISVFISSITFFQEPFEGYLHYIIFLLLLPYFYFRFGFPAKPMRILVIPLMLGIVQIVLGNNTPELFVKVFGGVLLSSVFYYYVMLYYELDVERIFKFYLKGAVIVSIIGIVQFVSYLVRFSPGYNYQWLFNKWGLIPGEFGIRVNSVFSEASQFAIFLGPACFVAIYNLMLGNRYVLKRWQSALILVVTILTTSSTGYIGFLVIIFVLMLNYGRIGVFFVGILVSIIGGSLLYNNVEAFKSRVDTSVGLWITGEFSVANVNSSSFVLYNNYHIAIENFKENGLTGTGLGSHPIAFDKYSLTSRADILDIKFNKADGNSMLVRIISELGLVGIIFIIWFIFGNFVRRDPFDPGGSNNWLISGAVLVIIVLYMLRQGNYFINGFPLFMWMYYYSRHAPEKEEAPETEDEESEDETDDEYEEEDTVPVH